MSTINKIVFALFLLIFVASSEPSSSWTTYKGNAQRSGGTDYASGPLSCGFLWSSYVNGSISTMPIINDDSSDVYVTLDSGDLYSFTTSGSLNWRFPTQSKNPSSASLNPVDGSILFGSGKYVYAVNSDGSLKWKYLASSLVSASPAVGDTLVYVNSLDTLYALDLNTGKPQWTFSAVSINQNSPTIGNGTVLIVDSNKNRVIALNSTNGKVKWSFASDNNATITSTPSVSSNNILFFCCRSDGLYAVDAMHGKLKWKYSSRTIVDPSPTISVHGTVFVATNSSVIALVAQTGLVKWTYSDVAVTSTISVDNEDNVYFGSNFHMYALNNGHLQWTFSDSSANIFSSPSISGNGVLFIGASNSYLYALGNGGQSCN